MIWLHSPRDLSVPALQDASGLTAWTAAQLREDAERRGGEKGLRRFGIRVGSCALTSTPDAPAWSTP